jgi:hypothetical protein
MKSNKSDYLKYWRVIRYFVKAKYKVTQADLDVILFLYSEQYFGKEKFDEFNNLLSWDRGRFNRLLRDGWIHVFRKRVGKHKTLYQLSDKSINMVRLIYNKLEGEEIAMKADNNPLFKRNVSYEDKVYRNMIKEMNSFIRQQRHQSHE